MSDSPPSLGCLELVETPSPSDQAERPSIFPLPPRPPSIRNSSRRAINADEEQGVSAGRSSHRYAINQSAFLARRILMVDEMDSPPMKKAAKACTKRRQGEDTVVRARRLHQAVTDALDKRDQKERQENPFLLLYRPSSSRTPEDEQSFLMARLQETIGGMGAGDKENV